MGFTTSKFHFLTLIFVLLFSLTACNQSPKGKSADNHIFSAESFIKTGSYRSAVIEIKNALQKEPDNVNAYLIMCEALISMGDNPGAEKQLTQILEKHPQNSKAKLLLADALIRQLKFNSANLELSNLTPANDAEKTQQTLLKGQVLLGLNQPEEAKNQFNSILTSNNNDQDAIIGLSQTYYALGNKEKALELIDRSAQVSSSHIDTWMWSGRLNTLIENYNKASEAYSRALGLMTTYDTVTADKYMALEGIVNSLGAEGKISEALTYSEQLEATSQNQLKNEFLGALSSIKDGDYTAAEKDLLEILEASPEHGLTSTALGFVKFSQGDLAEAEAYLEKALAGGSVPLQAHKLLAITQLKLKKVDNAITLLNNALVEHKDDDELHALLGYTYLQAKKEKEAKKSLNRALEINPSNMGALISIATLQFQKNQPKQAIKYFEKALEVNPESLPALKGAVKSKQAMENQEAALEYLKSFVTNHPDNINPELMLAGYYFNQKNWADSLRHTQSAFNKNQDYKKSKALMGAIHFELSKEAAKNKEWQKAMELAQQSKTYSPLNPQVTLLQINIEMAQDHFDKALQHAKAYQKQAPESVAGFEFAGDLFLIKNRVNEAIAEYKEAWKIQPYQKLGLKYYRTLRKVEQPQQALAPIEEWVRQNTNNPQARMTLAMALQEENNKPRAIKEYEWLHKKFPENPVVLNNLAWLYYETKHQDAEKVAEKAHKIIPNSPAIADTYGWILLTNGKKKEALSILKKAFEGSGGNKEIKEHYIEALEANGLSQEAAALRKST